MWLVCGCTLKFLCRVDAAGLQPLFQGAPQRVTSGTAKEGGCISLRASTLKIKPTSGFHSAVTPGDFQVYGRLQPPPPFPALLRPLIVPSFRPCHLFQSLFPFRDFYRDVSKRELCQKWHCHRLLFTWQGCRSLLLSLPFPEIQGLAALQLPLQGHVVLRIVGAMVSTSI